MPILPIKGVCPRTTTQIRPDFIFQFVKNFKKFHNVVRPVGIEPTTISLKGELLYRLSYGRNYLIIFLINSLPLKLFNCFSLFMASVLVCILLYILISKVPCFVG